MDTMRNDCYREIKWLIFFYLFSNSCLHIKKGLYVKHYLCIITDITIKILIIINQDIIFHFCMQFVNVTRGSTFQPDNFLVTFSVSKELQWIDFSLSLHAFNFKIKLNNQGVRLHYVFNAIFYFHLWHLCLF